MLRHGQIATKIPSGMPSEKDTDEEVKYNQLVRAAVEEPLTRLCSWQAVANANTVDIDRRCSDECQNED